MDQNKLDCELVKYYFEVDRSFDSLHDRLAVWTNSTIGIIIAHISSEETVLLFNFFKGGDPCTLLG
jgi:hypothetical protein